MPEPVRCARCGTVRAEMPPEWLPDVEDPERGICGDCLQRCVRIAQARARDAFEQTYDYWLINLTAEILHGSQSSSEERAS